MPDGRHPASSSRERLRTVGEICLWLLLIAAVLIGALLLAARLRLVVLPVLLAVVLATLLAPPAAWLRRRGAPDALAAVGALGGFLLLIAGVLALIAPPTVAEFNELDVGVSGGLEEVQRWLAEGPLGLSDAQINRALDRVQEQVRSNVDTVSQSALSGAVIALEVLTGLLLALVVLFFLLKDGDRIWGWLVGLAPPAHRRGVHEAGERAWAALAGFLRGQTIVALFDATFIGLAIWILGVPLVLPLAVVTFFGSYVPVIGATVAGLAAALVALFAQGPVTAALVVAAILVVQQLEGNILQPYVVGRSVHVHPVAILLGLTAGGVLAGIIGAIVATPAVAVGAAILRYLRERADEDAPDAAGTDAARPDHAAATSS